MVLLGSVITFKMKMRNRSLAHSTVLDGPTHFSDYNVYLQSEKRSFGSKNESFP
jgi:hypothetical protein